MRPRSHLHPPVKWLNSLVVPVFHVEMRWRCGACEVENLGRHKVCQNCSKPKDREPFYDAPETQEPTVGQAVTDHALIARASAGADWLCRYCGSHQPRNTGECRNCGAPEADASQPATWDRAKRASSAAGSRDAELSAPNPRSKPRLKTTHLVLMAVVSVIGLAFWLLRSREVEASVVQRLWQHSVVIERYQVLPGEGFAETRPSGAFDVVQKGQRHHHDQRVQDGTKRESYSERVACGEDCSTSPVRCSSNDNGFKTCSGGDRVCKTRYCSETRYRDVPNYRQVPVYQPWYTWRAWQWQDHRTLVEKGAEEEPRWPTEAQLRVGIGCGPGEQERARREAKYEVVFEDAERKRYPYQAQNLTEFSVLRLGVTRKLRVHHTRKAELIDGS